MVIVLSGDGGNIPLERLFKFKSQIQQDSSQIK